VPAVAGIVIIVLAVAIATVVGTEHPRRRDDLLVDLLQEYLGFAQRAAQEGHGDGGALGRGRRGGRGKCALFQKYKRNERVIWCCTTTK